MYDYEYLNTEATELITQLSWDVRRRMETKENCDITL